MPRTLVFHTLTLSLACAALCDGRPAETTPADARLPRKGEMVAALRSTAKPEQSYALYLPSAYVGDQRWPVVYVFDPGAVGSRPLEQMKEAAERYGYVVAASNNSRNGPWPPQQEAAAEMWDDTHRRLSLDDRRVYFAGFSGGARVSALMAQLCGCAGGVFLNGAGFATGAPPTPKAVFPVFATTGLGDFNYGELLELESELERLGFPHLLWRFEGEHTWAPAAVWRDAFAWSALLEMKKGLRGRDQALVAAELANVLERGRRWQEQGEPSFAHGEYRSLIPLFEGLTDTAPLAERVAALEKDPATAGGRKREKAEIEKQRHLESRIVRDMEALRAEQGEALSLRAETALRIRRMQAELVEETRPEQRRILQRVLGNIFIRAMEGAGPLVDGGRPRTAIALFELATEARPDRSWPHLALARCHGLTGDKKAALRELTRAVEKGTTAGSLAEFVAANPRLAAVAVGEDYQKLLAQASAAGQ